MRYLGGKARLAKELAQIINRYNVQTYHEPFCGMFNVGSQVAAPARSAADIQEDLILLHRAVQQGWTGPDTVTERQYNELKTAEPSALRAFAGFGCSNSGKFFGGYARESTGRNFAANAKASLIKLAPLIRDVRFDLQDYRDFDRRVDMIYCDPPYDKTTGYTVGPFDTGEFWQWVREYGRRSIVLVSEYVAPEWATVIWQKAVKTDMNAREGGKINRVEKLFTVGV